MSKIFDMLNRGKGTVPDLVQPLVDGELLRTPHVQVNFKRESETVATPSATPPVEVRAPLADGVSGVRRVGLSISQRSPLLPFENGQWRPSEQYRILRTKIIQHPRQPSVIVISSPGPGDGKSVTAINTAGALSLKSEANVLLLDADLRKSALHKQLGLPESPGLSDALSGTCTLEDALVRTEEFPNLYVMTAGTRRADPAELLDSTRWQSLTAALRGMFRYVIVDSPPAGAVADYDLIQAVCDGVILVLRPDYTNRHLAQKALETVPNSKFLGVLLNCVPDWGPAKRGDTDYYYYSGEKPSSGKGRGAPEAAAARE